MADKKISALTAASTPLAGTEVLPIVQSGSTVKVSAANITAGRSVDMASFSAKQATANQNVFVQNTTALTAGNTASAWFGNGTTSFGANDRQWGLSVFVTAGATNTDLQVVYYNGTTYVTPFTFDSSSNLKVGTAAKGVNFTANTPAAGMTSQLLNWYEEGYYTATLTPGTSGSITVNSSNDQLAYTRIGRVVHVQGFIDASSVSSPVGAIVKLNLPFNCASLNEGADYSAGSWVFTDAPSYTPNTKSLVVNPTTNIAELIIDASTVGNGDEFLIGFSYIAG